MVNSVSNERKGKKKIPLASQFMSQGMKKKYPLLLMIIQAYQIIITQILTQAWNQKDKWKA
jgi:hypothetical protein